MPRVLISDKISPQAEELFLTRGVDVDVLPGLAPQALREIIGEYDGIVVRSSTRLTPDLLDAARRLKVIGRAGIGVDNVDIPAASLRGIVVMNTPFSNTVTTAEHTVALLMAAARHLPAATASTRAGKWEKNSFMGLELCGKRAGVIGIGNVGALVVERLLGLKMKVVAFDPFISRERAEQMGVTLVDDLDAFWPQVDVITIHTPLTPATKYLVNGAAFAKMKKGAILVNCARGGLVDEEALYHALQSGKLFAAALDVLEEEPCYSHKLFELNNVVFTPHLGASTFEAQVSVAVQIAEQVSDFLLKGVVRNALNLPAVSEQEMPRLRPYLDLSEKLGLTLGQLTLAGVDKIEIAYEGEVTQLNYRALTTLIVRSILAPVLDVSINLVNALVIARERKILVDEIVRNRTGGGLAAQITVTLMANGVRRTIAGTLFDDTHPRIIMLDDVPIEAIPAGNLLFIANRDVPGLIGKIGTILGDAELNIAGFQLGREKPAGRAVAFINLDEAPSAEVVERLRRVPHILEVAHIHY